MHVSTTMCHGFVFSYFLVSQGYLWSHRDSWLVSQPPGVSCCLSGFHHGVSSPLTLTLKLLTLGCFSLLVHELLPKQWVWEHGYSVEPAYKNILFQYNMQIEECTDLQCMGFGSFTNL